MAAGKTTLTKGIARGLGIEEEITSPTFTLLNEYSGRLPFYHMDAYRLSGSDDFLALGSDEIVYGDGVCAVEWSERVADALPKVVTVVSLETVDGERRDISLSGPLEEALS